jgi:hypothetical protein
MHQQPAYRAAANSDSCNLLELLAVIIDGHNTATGLLSVEKKYILKVYREL